MTRVVLLLLMFIQLLQIRANYPFLEQVEKVEEKNLENLLLRMLMERTNKFGRPVKRTCQIEATGECRSEEAAEVADKYHYLLSSKSPGRKRNLFS